MPRADLCARTKWVTARATEAVPVTGGELKKLLHGAASNHAVLIIVFKGEWIIRIGSFKLDFADAREIFFIAD